MVYGVGLPLEEAIPTSLIVVGAASAVAVLPRLRTGVNWRLAGIIGAAGIPTAYLGTLVNRLVDPQLLLVAFSVIMVIAGLRMFFATPPQVALARCLAAAPGGAAVYPVRWPRAPWSGS